LFLSDSKYLAAHLGKMDAGQESPLARVSTAVLTRRSFSRINHSCNPLNTVVEWEKESHRIEVRAVRMIKKGEELTGNYLEDLVGTRN
jgi:SET domain-containing protein